MLRVVIVVVVSPKTVLSFCMQNRLYHAVFISRTPWGICDLDLIPSPS
ncbi:hypothetical protein HMPREF0454_03149 [Hafnia alvei ATCC 51873]|uniref:Uncharacterized protein n=1 Tax=Hafnia alvei ATCC 51873 TaxID=1002364 RepID=G9Y9I1_HAFAL|nr:hypothetical protein HMPREF0454_03149 [Hafnia alvei ATCC 51873]